MPRRKKDQPPGRLGPAPKDPTPEQMVRIPELKERAHEIGLLGDENDLLLAAAHVVEQVQVRIGAAMAIRGKRKVDPNRPGREPAEEIVALEKLEKSALAFARRHATMNGASHPDARQRLEAWAADIARDPGPVNHRIRAIRCLLRFAEDMLRAEVRLANAHEHVPLPGETEKQILDGLLETELGLKGVAAARTFGICKKAGVMVVGAQSMRGLHATLAVDAGITSHAVAAALGHESFTTTARSYAKAEAVTAAKQWKTTRVLAGKANMANGSGVRPLEHGKLHNFLHNFSGSERDVVKGGSGK